jgi:drug/metabolite transporter (DMT)-like permease
MTLSCVLLAPGMLLAPSGRPGPTTSVALVALGTAATGGSLLLFYHLIGRLGAVRANLGRFVRII